MEMPQLSSDFEGIARMIEENNVVPLNEANRAVRKMHVPKQLAI